MSNNEFKTLAELGKTNELLFEVFSSINACRYRVKYIGHHSAVIDLLENKNWIECPMAVSTQECSWKLAPKERPKHAFYWYWCSRDGFELSSRQHTEEEATQRTNFHSWPAKMNDDGTFTEPE